MHQKYVDAKRVRETLAGQIKQKHEGREEAQRFAAELELSNARFNNMKNMFADRRKEFTNQQALYL